VPLAITIDRASNIFATESYSAVIWKITPAGAASIIAGVPVNGSYQIIDGTGAAVRLGLPEGLAADAAGNLFFSDYNSIRKLTPDGVATTLAGAIGPSGSTDGTGSAAHFSGPTGIAVDNAGRLYVADTDNHTIRMGVAASAPVILTQPLSLTAYSGANVQLSVTVAGVPAPTLQWYRNGSTVTGATGSTLTLVGVLASDTGDYTVTATNDLGSVASNKATLTVNAGPVVLTGFRGIGWGGGGAPSLWFYGALSLLMVIRRWMARMR
jgi:hypothetical protein